MSQISYRLVVRIHGFHPCDQISNPCGRSRLLTPLLPPETFFFVPWGGAGSCGDLWGPLGACGGALGACGPTSGPRQAPSGPVLLPRGPLRLCEGPLLLRWSFLSPQPPRQGGGWGAEKFSFWNYFFVHRDFPFCLLDPFRSSLFVTVDPSLGPQGSLLLTGAPPFSPQGARPSLTWEAPLRLFEGPQGAGWLPVAPASRILRS